MAACHIQLPGKLPGLNLLDERAVNARRQLYGECYTHTVVEVAEPAKGLLWRWTVRGNWKLILPVATAGDLLAGEGRIITEQSAAKFARGEAELYDILRDPAETHDMAAVHPAIARELQMNIEAWWSPEPERAFLKQPESRGP